MFKAFGVCVCVCGGGGGGGGGVGDTIYAVLLNIFAPSFDLLLEIRLSLCLLVYF